MQKQPIKIDRRKILIVEGNDIERFLCHFLPYLGFQNNSDGFQIINFDKVISVGIIRDVEQSDTRTFQSTIDAITFSKLAPPSMPYDVSNGNPKVGVALLPPKSNDGMLETMLLETVIEKSLLSCVSALFDCARVSHPHPKARLLAYLAARNETESRIGLAAARGHFDFNHPTFDPLREFLYEIAKS
jgi:hypothetical protein